MTKRRLKIRPVLITLNVSLLIIIALFYTFRLVKYYLKENDILMAVRSGSKRLVGKSAVVNSDFEGYSFGAFMSKIRVLDVDSNFINYFWNTTVLH